MTVSRLRCSSSLSCAEGNCAGSAGLETMAVSCGTDCCWAHATDAARHNMSVMVVRETLQPITEPRPSLCKGCELARNVQPGGIPESVLGITSGPPLQEEP